MNLHTHYRDVRARLMNPAIAFDDPPPERAPRLVPVAPPPQQAASAPETWLPALASSPSLHPAPRLVNGSDSVIMPPNVIRDMVSAAAEKHGVSRADIMGNCRRKNIVAARREVMYRAVEAGYSLNEVGSRIDRDHTSVLHGHSKFKAMLEAGEASL